jgi:hypothetical protein
MIKNTNELMADSLAIAQQLAPFDTGNLRHNAIRAYITPTGYRVVMLYTAAFYGVILNQSQNKHKGWWDNARLTIIDYVDAALNNKKSNFQIDHEGIAKFAADDPRRRARFHNSMVADSGRDKFIAGV